MQRKGFIIFCIGIISLLFVPRFLREYHFYMVNLVLVYVLIGMGLNFLMGLTGQINLGNAAFFGLGAYTSALLATKLNLPYLLSIPISGVVTALFGVVVAFPGSRVRGHYLALVTFSFLAIFQVVATHWRSLTNGQTGIVIPTITVGSYTLSGNNYIYFLVVPIILFFIWLTSNIMSSELGMKLIAIRDSEIAAESVGINLLKYKIISFAICSFYTGVAGSLYGLVVGYINPEPFGIRESLDHIILLIIGGLGTFGGPIVGAVLFVVLPEIFVPLAEYKVIIFGLTVLIFILFLPRGLVGGLEERITQYTSKQGFVRKKNYI